MLFIDGWCESCRRAARSLARLDWRDHLEVRSFRSDRSFRHFGLEQEDVERSMQLIRVERGERSSGFAALVALARLLPPLWPFFPLLAVAGEVGLGERIYRWVAARRTIIPEPSFCELPTPR